MDIVKEDTILQIGHYKLAQTLGIGAFGKVKRGMHIYTECPVAIKIISRKLVNKDKATYEKVKREIQILKLMKFHPNVVHLYQVLEAPSDVFIIMELVEGKDLFSYLVSSGRLSEEDARYLFQQMISALSYCHSLNVIHRDLKPENILISMDHHKIVKIADFGLANFSLDGEFLSSAVGSINYASPEVLAHGLYVGTEIDIWSLGIILYAMVVGSLPFDDEGHRLMVKIMRGIYPIPSFLSDSINNLLSKMICVDPMTRCTLNEVKTHPWFIKACYYETRVEVEEKEIHSIIFQELLSLKPFYPLAKYPTLVCEWLELGLQWKKWGTSTHPKLSLLCFDLRISYELLLDKRLQQNYVHLLKETLSSSHKKQHPMEIVEKEELATTPAPATRTFFLGIQSRKEICIVMGTIFHALQRIKAQWIEHSTYRLFCRWKPSLLGANNAAKNHNKWLYISLQIYRLKTNKSNHCEYLLDFQRLGSYSNEFNFMNFCTLIMNSLKISSSRKTIAEDLSNIGED